MTRREGLPGEHMSGNWLSRRGCGRLEFDVAPPTKPVLLSDHDRPHQDRARKTIRSTLCTRAPHHRLGCAELAAAGMTEREILDDYPELEADDFPAVYDFAAHMGRRVALLKLLFRRERRGPHEGARESFAQAYRTDASKRLPSGFGSCGGGRFARASG